MKEVKKLFGIFFQYKDDNKEHLIECFANKQDALAAMGRYVIGPGDKVYVEAIRSSKKGIGGSKKLGGALT